VKQDPTLLFLKITGKYMMLIPSLLRLNKKCPWNHLTNQFHWTRRINTRAGQRALDIPVTKRAQEIPVTNRQIQPETPA